MHAMICIWRSSDTFWDWVVPFDNRLPGIELLSSGLGGRHLYWWSHLNATFCYSIFWLHSTLLNLLTPQAHLLHPFYAFLWNVYFLKCQTKANKGIIWPNDAMASYLLLILCVYQLLSLFKRIFYWICLWIAWFSSHTLHYNLTSIIKILWSQYNFFPFVGVGV